MTTDVREGAVAEYLATHSGIGVVVRGVEACATAIRTRDAPSLRLARQTVEHDADDPADRPKLVLWYTIDNDVPWEMLDQLDDRLWDALGRADRHVTIVLEHAPRHLASEPHDDSLWPPRVAPVLRALRLLRAEMKRDASLGGEALRAALGGAED